MQIKFQQDDIVVAASAYGHSIVRVEHCDLEDPTFYLVADDSNDKAMIMWRGSFESCLRALAEDMEMFFSNEALWRQPMDEVNNLIERL